MYIHQTVRFRTAWVEFDRFGKLVKTVKIAYLSHLVIFSFNHTLEGHVLEAI